MTYHKLLQKQLKKYLPAQYLDDEQINVFLSVVSDCYHTFDKDKKMSEHAFAISEKEYQSVLNDLKEQNELIYWSIRQLRDAIHSLDPDNAHVPENSDDIIYIINFLQHQIAKSKEIENYLKEAKIMADRASRAKSEFLSVMSHEIRTPLNAIIGYIHLLNQEDPMPSQLEYLTILKISADNLLTLINDVLDFSKIEEGKISFANSDFDMRKLINNIKLANKIKANENGNTIKVMFDDEVPDIVKGDITRITQVLNNLLSNAIKFTKNGQIVLEVQLNKLTEEIVSIDFSVRDTGIGISKENQEKIFERFTQEHSYITREYGGSGLGLAIIKKLLLLQDSDISLESEVGKGSRFFFNLKFGRSKLNFREIEQKTVTREDLAGTRVLIVEDVEFNTLLARKMVQSWNCIPDTAENGLIAVEKVKNGDYDIILMDVQMPVMDGLTATTEIRKFNDEIPIIALTASTSTELQQNFKELGVNDFIFKPIHPDSLHKILFKYVK